MRDIELVLEDIGKLRDAYDPVFIGLTDSSLHPKRLEQIVDYNDNNEKKVNFTAFIRFEKEFKSPTFCQKLADGGFLGGQVGLESGVQRVNDIINKGVDIGDVIIAEIETLKRGQRQEGREVADMVPVDVELLKAGQAGDRRYIADAVVD